MELFCENSKGLKVLNYFHRKAPSQMFGRVLMPLLYNSEHVSLYRIIWWSKYWKLFWKIVLKYRIKMFFFIENACQQQALKIELLLRSYSKFFRRFSEKSLGETNSVGYFCCR